MKAFSQLTVNVSDRFSAFSNLHNWKYIAEIGQLTIYYAPNPAYQINYVYSSIVIRDSRIYDFDNKTFPGILFTNITFEPRCFEPKHYIDFKPPYVFVADPYWPSVSVFDQGGYRIIELAYAKTAQYASDQNITDINYHHFFSHCPRKTFQLFGECYS